MSYNEDDERIQKRSTLARETVRHPPQQPLDEFGLPDESQPAVLSSYAKLVEIPSGETVAGQIASREIEDLTVTNYTALSQRKPVSRETGMTYESSPLEQAQDRLTPPPRQGRPYHRPRIPHPRF